MSTLSYKFSFCIAEKNTGQFSYLFILRYSLVVIFFWFGGMKFTHYEALGISIFIENSPLISWLHVIFGIQGASYFLGTTEIFTGILLLLGTLSGLLSFFGALLSSITFFVTMTFFITTPGVFEYSLGGAPAISAGIGQFILKDLVLLSASLCLLKASIKRQDTLTNN